jgi:hypothetical protein
MAEKSQGLGMDADYHEGTTAPQMITISVIAIADRENYLRS